MLSIWRDGSSGKYSPAVLRGVDGPPRKKKLVFWGGFCLPHGDGPIVGHLGDLTFFSKHFTSNSIIASNPS